MTGLADIALAFCREVLEWTSPTVGATSTVIVQHVKDEENRLFRFTDLNAVTGAVRGWCDKNDHWLAINSLFSNGWLAEVGLNNSEHGTDSISDDLCRALLGACVEAARKMREAA